MLIRLHHLLLSTTPSRQNSSLPEEMEAGRESSRTRVMAMLLLRRHRSSPLPPAAHARNKGEKKLLRHWKGRTPLPSSTAVVAQHCRRGRTQKYETPLVQKERKKSCPKSTHNPSGILEASIKWSNVSKASFVKLGISQSLEEEIYLAAFLACWLCMFVLPSTPMRTIHPETFKMACTIASGNKNDKDFIFCDNKRGNEEDFDYFKDITIIGNLNIPADGGRTQEKGDHQLVALRKGKAPAQRATSSHGQTSRQATQKMREEQVRQRSSDEDAPSERQNNRDFNFLDPKVAFHRATLPSNTPHEEAQSNPSQVSIFPSVECFLSRYTAFVTGLWSNICEKLRKAPIENISPFKRSVERQLQQMKRDRVDLEAQQEHSKVQTLLLDQQKILEDSDKQETLPEEAIKEVEKVIKDSKEKSMKFHAQKPELQDLVAKAQERHNASQDDVTTIKKEVTCVKRGMAS
nr:uncharacterized protein LOC109157601 [Ipomoea batatas]